MSSDRYAAFPSLQLERPAEGVLRIVMTTAAGCADPPAR
jgi:hypothetical protein